MNDAPRRQEPLTDEQIHNQMQDLSDYFEMPVHKLRITCNTCAVKRTCPYSFDPYNIEGDCMVEK